MKSTLKFAIKSYNLIEEGRILNLIEVKNYVGPINVIVTITDIVVNLWGSIVMFLLSFSDSEDLESKKIGEEFRRILYPAVKNREQQTTNHLQTKHLDCSLIDTQSLTQKLIPPIISFSQNIYIERL